MIFFCLFLLKKNVQKKILILKNFNKKRKNYKKKKPQFIKFNYFKLLKNISSYHNEKNQILYNSDFNNNLILKLNFNLTFFSINFKNLNNLNLIYYNLFKFIKF